MRPSDMDAIARVVAQLVEEAVEERTKDFKSVDHSEAIAALTKTVEEQSEYIDMLEKSLTNVIDGVSAVEARVTALPELPETVSKEEFAELSENMRQLDAARTAEIDALDKIIEKTKQDITNVFKAVEALPTPEPQEVDTDLIVATIVKGLPDMIRSEMPEPPQALMPTDLQVIEAVKAVYPSIRQDIVRQLPRMEHKGVWKPDAQYDIGDEVIKSGATYSMMEPTTDAPPSEAWQMISQGRIGKKGLKGDKGDKGDIGIGVKDVAFEDGILTIQLTDDNVHTWDIGEQLEAAIIKHLNPPEE